MTNDADLAAQAAELQKARKDWGMTQAQAADRVGVSHFMWYRWEAGQRPITDHYRDLIREISEFHRDVTGDG